ncbi:hypothetical protein KC872_00820 [Candidatus Kaiserbacteria bacterium]|nr:hypothetical protein [Candidatus Kaiserbacteria bacterium]
MKNNTRLVIVILTVVVIVAAVVLGFKIFSPVSDSGDDSESIFVAPTDDPIDVTMEFYQTWLDAMLSTSTNPYELKLYESVLLSAELRESLKSSLEKSATDANLVLCQKEMPTKIGAKIIYTSETESQVMVIPRRSDAPESAIVTLKVKDSKWFINDISCSRGEFAPEREFNFEQEGFILKQSLLPPLDSQYWHLVFTQDNVQGHTTPLFFDDASTCINSDGSESVCVPDQLTEATKVQVRGDMTESGVNIKRLEFVQ